MTELFQIKCVDTVLLESEKKRVMKLLRKLTPHGSVIEVGSTAVAGVVGKQDIDFVVRAPEPAFVKTRQIMDAHLKRNPNQLSNAEYQGYCVESPLDIAVQLIVSGGPYDNFERFLEALRSNPELVESYNHLKYKWNGKPMDAYRRAKRDFIESVVGPNKIVN